MKKGPIDMTTSTQTAPNRARFYDKISAYNLAPLWEVLHDLVTPAPKTP